MKQSSLNYSNLQPRHRGIRSIRQTFQWAIYSENCTALNLLEDMGLNKTNIGVPLGEEKNSTQRESLFLGNGNLIYN